jgi:hypothetical protein
MGQLPRAWASGEGFHSRMVVAQLFVRAGSSSVLPISWWWRFPWCVKSSSFAIKYSTCVLWCVRSVGGEGSRGICRMLSRVWFFSLASWHVWYIWAQGELHCLQTGAAPFDPGREGSAPFLEVETDASRINHWPIKMVIFNDASRVRNLHVVVVCGNGLWLWCFK